MISDMVRFLDFISVVLFILTVFLMGTMAVLIHLLKTFYAKIEEGENGLKQRDDQSFYGSDNKDLGGPGQIGGQAGIDTEKLECTFWDDRRFRKQSTDWPQLNRRKRA